MKIQPIVEGQGEVKAVPALLRRLRDASGTYDIDVLRPIRRPRAEFFTQATVARAVEVARGVEGCGAILLLVDADDDCPKQAAPRIETWAIEAAGGTPCAVVLANREYEAWFLAAIESLRGKRGVREDATSHPDPENPRGAKAKLEERMFSNRTYGETIDQAPLTSAFDMAATYRRCRSFRKLVKAFGELAAGVGAQLAAWPPAAWVEEPGNAGEAAR